MKYIFLILVVILGYSYAHGQVKTFNLLGAEWHNPLAWTPVGVPTANDSVLIIGVCFIKPDSTARAKHVLIDQIFGILEIQRDIPANKRGSLVINDAPGNGLVNEGIFINGGRLTIRRTTDTAVVNRGYFEILDLARVVIDSTVNDLGICNFKELSNNGLIEISRIETNGISNFDSIENKSLGEIRIEDTGELGILNAAIFNNHGIISILNTGFLGLENDSVFTNYDSLLVENTVAAGIHNLNLLSNKPGGYIFISNVSSGSGILNRKDFENEGEIFCVEAGVNNWFGQFINRSSIDISAPVDFGISNRGVFTNETNANILIRNISGGSTARGFFNFNLSKLFNHGKIDIRNIDGNGIDNLGFIKNFDTISIKEYETWGLYNLDSLINTGSGFLDISNILYAPSDIGLNNEASAVVLNAGTCVIKKAELSIQNLGWMSNENILKGEDGLIGLSNGIDDTAMFINVGELLLDKLDTGILNKGNLTNLLSGQILISDYKGDPFESILGSVFDCLGTLEMHKY